VEVDGEMGESGLSAAVPVMAPAAVRKERRETTGALPEGVMVRQQCDGAGELVRARFCAGVTLLDWTNTVKVAEPLPPRNGVRASPGNPAPEVHPVRERFAVSDEPAPAWTGADRRTRPTAGCCGGRPGSDQGVLKRRTFDGAGPNSFADEFCWCDRRLPDHKKDAVGDLHAR
jgi:hypothetical protein